MSALWLDDGDVRLYHGDAIATLAALPAGSVDCCITSPPYYGLRDYGVDGQIGLEDTPEAFLARLVEVFRGVRRVLAPYGTCWVNLGDSYNAYNANRGPSGGFSDGASGRSHPAHARGLTTDTAKPKDLLMMPARLALALQADGWWLRSDIIWSKPNPMPESVTDLPTSAHEHVFLLTRAPRYWYDAEAIREKGGNWGTRDRTDAKHNGEAFAAAGQRPHGNLTGGDYSATGRNARNVWTIATQPTPEAHFATYPEELVRRCLLAGCPPQVCRTCGIPRQRVVERIDQGYDGSRYGERAVDATGGAINGGTARSTLGSSGGALTGQTASRGWTDCGHGDYRPGVVLDPFMGSGTTAIVARAHARDAVGIELSEEYLGIAAKRIRSRAQMAMTLEAAS